MIVPTSNPPDTMVHRLGRFVEHTSFEMLSPRAVDQLKIRVMDAMGCAIAARDGGPIVALREHIEEFGGGDQCTLIGGGRTSPDRAALHNSARVRYLDFNDSYLAPKETCHPSDNFGAILAAAEYSGASGQALLTALAVAYQVQCRLSDKAPVRDKGFDHTVQGQYAAAAGVSRALGLDADRIANAVAISATAHNALRVTRTGALSHWKGLAYPETAFTATHSALLAMRGITGPAEVFEGNKGFQWAIAGEFDLDWASEDLERVTRTIVKKYNAEIHSQATLEGVLELQAEHNIDPATIDHVHIDTFDVAYHIIGGGEEGDKTRVHQKEEADHSLPYMVAVALLDGQVLPAQYEPQRIEREDVQRLLRLVTVGEKAQHSSRFPEAMPCDIAIHASGETYTCHKDDYEGFYTRPMPLETAKDKFHRLTEPFINQPRREALLELVMNMDQAQTRDLAGLLQDSSSSKTQI